MNAASSRYNGPIVQTNKRLSTRKLSDSEIPKDTIIHEKSRSFSVTDEDRLSKKLMFICGPQWCKRKSELLKHHILNKPRKEGASVKTYSKLWNYYFELKRNSLQIKPKPRLENPIEPSKGLGPWSVLWKYKEATFKAKSPYHEFSSLKIRPMIIKSGDDLRQEYLALSLIRCFKSIFDREKSNIYLRPYDVIIRNHNSGFIGRLTYKVRIHY